MDAQEAVEMSLHGALILYGVRVLDPHTVAIPASNLDVAGLAEVALSGLKFAGYEVVKAELGTETSHV